MFFLFLSFCHSPFNKTNTKRISEREQYGNHNDRNRDRDIDRERGKFMQNVTVSAEGNNFHVDNLSLKIELLLPETFCLIS